MHERKTGRREQNYGSKLANDIKPPDWLEAEKEREVKKKKNFKK